MLLPGNADVGDLGADREAALQAIADLYAYPDRLPDRGWVRANMISSLDGAASDDGRSGGLGGPADKAVFAVLRALADVILVGAGTVRAEKYLPPEPDPEFADRRAAAGQSPAPSLAVVTRTGKLDPRLFEGDNPSWVVTTADADLDALRALAGPDRVIVAGEGEPDVADAVKVLAGRGLKRVLLEGGPSLLGQALAAQRVEELCLTWSAILLGGDAPRIATGPSSRLRARPAHLIQAGDLLLGRWFVHGPPDT